MELDNLQNSYAAATKSPNSSVTTTASSSISSNASSSAKALKSEPVQISTEQARVSAQRSESAVYASTSNVDDKKGNVIDDKARSAAKLMDDAVNEANKKLTEMHLNQELQMSMHNVTKAIMVKVVDTSTKEVIREYPPQKLQDMIAKMWLQAGILVDEKR